MNEGNFGVPPQAKNLAERLIKEPVEFEFSWTFNMEEGFRTPKSVTLPSGRTMGVGYMRDGHIQLIDDEGGVHEALYERITDEEGEGKEQRISIKYDSLLDQQDEG